MVLTAISYLDFPTAMNEVMKVVGVDVNERALLLATENAPEGKRSWYGMFPQLGAPLGFIIANGVSFGIISYCAIKLLSGQARKVSPILYVIAALLLARYLFLVNE